MVLILRPRTLLSLLSLLALSLLLAHLITQALKYFWGHDYQLGFERLFNLDRENNIPSWYSSSALLLCSALLAMIWLAKKQARERYVAHWAALSMIFLALSLDEAASLHERAIDPLRQALHATGYLYYTWVVPGIALVLVIGLCYLPFLAHLPTRTRRLCLLAGSLYVGGAVGVEMLGAQYHSLHGVDTQAGVDTMAYALIVACEEGLELLGILVFIYALSSYLGSSIGPIRLVFGEPGRPAIYVVPARTKRLPAIKAAGDEKAPLAPSPLSAHARPDSP